MTRPSEKPSEAPTPRTDAMVKVSVPIKTSGGIVKQEWVPIEDARQLERELASARAAIIEECAKVADYFDFANNGNAGKHIADAIRALDTKQESGK